MTSLHISIPKPCAENWENMTTVDRGRSCDKCNKVVKDFTHYTNEELVNQFLINKENTCGRFYKQQLAGKISKERTLSNLFRKLKMTAIALTAILGIEPILAGKANAQNINFAGEHFNKSNIKLSKFKSTDTSKIIIAGMLKDKETNEAIPFAVIVIKNGEQMLGSGESDDEGKFSVEFAKEDFSFTRVDILVSYLGYEPLKIQNLPLDNSSVYVNLGMTGNTMVLGEFVISNPRLVDPGQTTTGSIFTKDEIKHLPK